MRRVAFACILFAAIGCTRPLPPASDHAGSSREEDALSFEVATWPEGKPYAIAQDRGSVVLLDVWATWCEPCRDALPMYEQLAKEYGARGLKVYAMNIDEDPQQIVAFLEETKVGVPILYDEGARVAEGLLKVKMMPTTFLLDRKGVVRFVHQGFGEEFLVKYQAQIEQLLNE